MRRPASHNLFGRLSTSVLSVGCVCYHSPDPLATYWQWSYIAAQCLHLTHKPWRVLPNSARIATFSMELRRNELSRSGITLCLHWVRCTRYWTDQQAWPFSCRRPL